MVLERILGTDSRHELASMTRAQMTVLAARIVDAAEQRSAVAVEVERTATEEVRFQLRMQGVRVIEGQHLVDVLVAVAADRAKLVATAQRAGQRAEFLFGRCDWRGLRRL